MTDRFTFFATCAPGIEPLLHAEAKALKLAKTERQVGGVRFEGTLRDAWRANLWLRTAVRVLLRLERFEAVSEEELYAGAGRVQWERYLRPEGTLIVDAQAKESALDHTRFVEQRVKDAIVDQLREATGQRPSVEREGAELGVHVHIFRDRVTLSLDTSGASLHKRGWRVHQGRAPLAETLAAAVVLASEWDQRAPLLDPFCGSGTILIEAAMLAAGIAPGLSRKRFGFEAWPGHDASAFAAARENARNAPRFPTKLRLLGSDRDAQQIESARANARSAGVDSLVELECAGATDFAPRRGWNAWIVTNPPYGERVGSERELRPLYAAFGELLRERCAGYHLALLSGNAELAQELRLPGAQRTVLQNGALACELLTATL